MDDPKEEHARHQAKMDHAIIERCSEPPSQHHFGHEPSHYLDRGQDARRRRRLA